MQTLTLSFNPRAHAGRDAELCDMGGMSVVSIHAPTQGATYYRRSACRLCDGFNPRAHAGRDI